MVAGQELSSQLRERMLRCERFKMDTPGTSPERGRSYSTGGSSQETPVALATDGQGQPGRKVDSWRSRPLLAAVAAATMAILLAVILAWLGGSSKGEDLSSQSATNARAEEAFERLYGRKLDSIKASVTSLQGLSEVVSRADDTYDEVYHNQLVQSSRRPGSPDEEEWNTFVREARSTAPAFLEGKEKLRESVANLHRLIRRSPDFMRHMIGGISKNDLEEATWFLRKVTTLAESVHSSMEAAAEKFGAVDMELEGMTRDARENEEHLEVKAVRLSEEAMALEGSRPVRVGAWARHAESALWGCILEKKVESLDGCKEACLAHASDACDRIAYYKTATRNRCYLHCSTATEGKYREADVYLLERGPEELATDALQKRRAGAVAGQLQLRWRSVRSPLRDVTRLVRRFRTATAELRTGLHEVRFAANDLNAAFEASELTSGRLDLRQLERRVGDVLAAVEDVGHTLTPMSSGVSSP